MVTIIIILASGHYYLKDVMSSIIIRGVEGLRDCHAFILLITCCAIMEIGEQRVIGVQSSEQSADPKVIHSGGIVPKVKST